MDKKARSAIKEKVGDVKELSLDLTKIDENGLFVNVTAGGQSKLDTSLSWQSLGVTELPRNLAMRIGNPSGGLLPEDHRAALKRPVAEGYKLLREYGFRMTVAEAWFGRDAHRYIPYTAWDAFDEAFTYQQELLDAAKRDAIKNHPAIVEQMEWSFVQLATDAQIKLRRQGVELGENFVDRVVASLVAKIPTPDDIKSMFLRRDVGVLAFGSDMYQERAQAAEAKERAQAANQRMIARQRIIEERANALRLDAEQKRRYVEQELRKEAESKERIRKLKEQAAQEAREEWVSPIREIGDQVHATLYTICKDLAESLSKNGFVHGKTARKATEMAEWFRAMNFMDDAEMEARIKSIEAIAQEASGHRDPQAFQSAVDSLLKATRAGAISLSRRSQFKALEV